MWRLLSSTSMGAARSSNPRIPSPRLAEVVRLWAVSDIHTDLEANWTWTQRLSDTAYRRDALIVAGDVSDNLEMLELTLRTLKSKFGTVFFTPGNHDLWLQEEEAAEGLDSMEKLRHIMLSCKELGVETKPSRVGPPGATVWVCPLLSFHHQSFDTEPDLRGRAIPPPERVMCDYWACSYKPPLSMFDDSVALAMDALNDTAALASRDPAKEPLVTFSHFLPRPELLLEKRFLLAPQLAKAAGSRFLGDRVQRLGPDVHIFGHTHFGWDAVHDGIRYIQAALAYPGERRARWASLANGAFGREGPLLVWFGHQSQALPRKPLAGGPPTTSTMPESRRRSSSSPVTPPGCSPRPMPGRRSACPTSATTPWRSRSARRP